MWFHRKGPANLTAEAFEAVGRAWAGGVNGQARARLVQS
jgi:hypothetical protein